MANGGALSKVPWLHRLRPLRKWASILAFLAALWQLLRRLWLRIAFWRGSRESAAAAPKGSDKKRRPKAKAKAKAPRPPKPPPSAGPWEACGFHFSSSFDSGNLCGAEATTAKPAEKAEQAEQAEKAEQAVEAEQAEQAEQAEKPEQAEQAEQAEKAEKAEQAEKAEKAEKVEGGVAGEPPCSAGDDTLTFNVTVRADCEGTPFESSDCQWFHFSMRGPVRPGLRLRFQVLGLSRFNGVDPRSIRGRLLTDGVRPVVRVGGGPWDFVSGERGVLKTEEGLLALGFEHVVHARGPEEQELHFAASFPYPLARVHAHLAALEDRAKHLYWHREVLLNSLGGRPVELLTITAASGQSQERQPPLAALNTQAERPFVFDGRRAVFVSARVHPGETPASFMLEGLLDFLASDNPTARALLERYVFHVVPVLNPDGVELGHHRTDTRGENLNRFYGRAKLDEHPSICAAEAACLAAHEHQGGLRLYLDLHAHSNRRGLFMLGDAADNGTKQVSAKLYGYALGRRCSLFEFAQSDFGHQVAGTGKSAAAAATGSALCFTVESNYYRGHHTVEPFRPPDWARYGASLLLALSDLDLIEESSPQLPPELLQDYMRAEDWLFAEAEGITLDPVDTGGASRACPRFAEVLRPSESHKPSRAVWASPELVGCLVEVTEMRAGPTRGTGRCRLHECHGGQWLAEEDLEFREQQEGYFVYSVVGTAPVTSGESPQSDAVGSLPPGTVLEANMRCVSEGVLRVRLAAKMGFCPAGGWVSEYRSAVFDSRLGGSAQLIRLSRRPRPAEWRGLHQYMSA